MLGTTLHGSGHRGWLARGPLLARTVLVQSVLDGAYADAQHFSCARRRAVGRLERRKDGKPLDLLHRRPGDTDGALGEWSHVDRQVLFPDGRPLAEHHGAL